MPTGGKLVGAFVFAALAWYASDLVIPLLPDGTPTGMFAPLNAIIGLLMGWRIMGKGAGVTYRQALGYGMTTVAATLFWVVLLWSAREMYRRSVRLYYDGPMEALQEMFQFMVEYLHLIGTEQIVLTLIAGGILGGLLTEFFARRWS